MPHSFHISGSSGGKKDACLVSMVCGVGHSTIDI